MHAQAGSLVSLTDTSLTDVILALCASGHFGVREAIAAATRQELRRLGSAHPTPRRAACFNLGRTRVVPRHSPEKGANSWLLSLPGA